MKYLVILLVLLVAAAGAGLLLHWLNGARIRKRLQRLGVNDEALAVQETDFREALLETLGNMLLRPAARADLTEKLLQAGYRAPWHVNAFVLIRAVFILAALAGGFIFFEVDPASILDQPMPFFKYLLFLVVCNRLPDWWLRDRAARNREKIIASVPQAVDFMTICVESGLSLEDTLDKVSAEMQRSAPELAAEFRLTRSEMLMLDRGRALRRLKKRTGVKEMENFADALLQSIRFGTPLVDTLQTIASESRANQVSTLEEKAGAISARVGVPLILMVLFPLVVLLAAPPIVAFIRNM